MDYNARYYSPFLGRFISPDTIVPAPADPQSLNRYSYALNNPIKYIDPSGHAQCVDLECEHKVNPINGELLGNKEFVTSIIDGSKQIYRRPSPPSRSEMELAFSFQAVGVGADAASVVESGIGAALEAALTLAGGFSSEGTGFQAGFLTGVGIYNKSGLNFAADTFSYASFEASLVSDVLLSNNYFAYNPDRQAYSLVVGTGTQFSTSTAVVGLLSPEAFSDLILDTAALLNDTISTLQLAKKLEPDSFFGSLSLPSTTPADEIFTGPKSIPLPQALNGVVEILK